jgi:hypothetical protein
MPAHEDRPRWPVDDGRAFGHDVGRLTEPDRMLEGQFTLGKILLPVIDN